MLPKHTDREYTDRFIISDGILDNIVWRVCFLYISSDRILLTLCKFSIHTWRKSMIMWIQGPWQYSKDFSRTSDKFYVQPWHFPCLDQSSSSRVLISPIAPKTMWTHLCWWHSAVSCRCMQITISIPSGNHPSQYLAFHYWTYCSVLRLECHRVPFKKSYAVFVRATWSPGLHGHLLQTITSKEDCALLRLLRWERCLAACRIRVELIGWTGCCVFVDTIQRCLVAAGHRHQN